MKKVIIIGATSGIGKALAAEYAKRGWQVGITGRRGALLDEIATLFPGQCYSKIFDVRETDTAMDSLRELIDQMGEVEQIIINVGMGHMNTVLDWDTEETCIATNVHGFAAMCNVAMQYFLRCGTGHLAAVSSIAAIRGIGGAPAYSASKAFVVNYLESLRGIAQRNKSNITVTNIQPGFVDTVMGQNEHAFWKASPEQAAQQIVDAMERQATQVYVTKRWRIVAWLLKILPNWVIDRIG